MRHQHVRIGPEQLPGELTLPEAPMGVVVFAHGSGSSHRSPRNQFVARHLQRHHLATLLIDMLTSDEASRRECVFDMSLLADRLMKAMDWCQQAEGLRDLPLGLYGVNTGAAAALIACAKRPRAVAGLVSAGGRADLAAAWLGEVNVPSLLIVGEADDDVVHLNRSAAERLRCESRLALIPRATHLFDEAGTLQAVAYLAAEWFESHLRLVPSLVTTEPKALNGVAELVR